VIGPRRSQGVNNLIRGNGLSNRLNGLGGNDSL
jgi:hypothetical protein